MKILIDLQGAQASNRNRGIGRYSLALAQGMARQAHGHDIWIALNSCFDDNIESLVGCFEGLIPQERILFWDPPGATAAVDPTKMSIRKSGECLREHFLANHRPDILHVSSLFEGWGDNSLTSIGLYGKPLPTAVTLYDLIPLIHRDRYLTNPCFETFYEEKLGSLRRAKLWLAISESSRREGIDFLNLPDDYVVNISAAADDIFQPLEIHPSDEQRLRHQYGILRPFIMYTGGIDIRKNVEGLIAAYAKLEYSIRKKHQLVIVCSAESAQIESLKQVATQLCLYDNDVIFTGYVTNQDMVHLYNLCRAFVFPSWHEGFGLPALEAMRCGAAVIAANNSSLPEVVGRTDALFNPYDVHSITAKLQHVLTDVGFRNQLKQHGLEQSKNFTWDRSARLALAGFEHLHASQQPPISARGTLGFTDYREPLAYISPLPPERSGISDYSAELLRELDRYYKITVIVNQPVVSDPWIVANCVIRDIDWFEHNAYRFDRILYNFGNSQFHQHMFKLLERFPGTVILHDFFLSGVLAHMDAHGYAPGTWDAALYDSHGYPAVRERYATQNDTEVNWKYPCSRQVVEHSNGVIVHSRLSKQLADSWYGVGTSENWVQIPHLRSPCLRTNDRNSTRAALGIGEHDFLVCSFGGIGPLKLNHRLLTAWQSSPLGSDQQCHLVFVGENHGGHYGAVLLHTINRHSSGERIKITGFVLPSQYATYLAAADVAVQLRTHTRGESSGAVLDCMNYGLPTIINAHGSMAEIAPDSVISIPDEFSQSQLISAIVKLRSAPSLRRNIGGRAKSLLLSNHHPLVVGKQYHAAIEKYAADGATSNRVNFLRRIAEIDKTSSTKNDLGTLVKSNSLRLLEANRTKQLLIDVSVLAGGDSKTGIQRVVRSILNELLSKPIDGYRVEPVFAGSDGVYRYARSFSCEFLCVPTGTLKDEPIRHGCNDIFLGLDLSPQHVPRCIGAFTRMRSAGTGIYFIVYDLIIAHRPEFFIESAYAGFDRWLRTVVHYGDGAVCISNAVAEELKKWIADKSPERINDIKISWCHLGADIESSRPTTEISVEFDQNLTSIRSNISILMVGTIEPRKGYTQTLSAFEMLWNAGVRVNLVIVGKPGWMVDDLLARLREHPQVGRQLFWFADASDLMLQKIYETVDGCLVASEAEGFGLPIVEAAKYKIPILARDIRVFKEVAGDSATYFNGTSPQELAAALVNWIKKLRTKEAIGSGEMKWLKWSECALNLLNVVLGLQGNKNTP